MRRRGFAALAMLSVFGFYSVVYRGHIHTVEDQQREALPPLTFMTTHKMGHFMSLSIARQYFPDREVALQCEQHKNALTGSIPADIGKAIRRPHGRSRSVAHCEKHGHDPASIPGCPQSSFCHVELRHYRHLSANTKVVMFVRNIVESVVSGYLYHKSGRECWLDGFGVPKGTPGTRKNAYYLSWPGYGSDFWKRRIVDKEGRYEHSTKNLCEILRDTEMERGVWIYAQVVYSYWYKDALHAFDHFMKRGQNVLYLCMKDIQRNVQDAVARIRAFHKGEAIPSSLASNKPSSQFYNGPHSTSKNETLRQKLAAIVRDVDINTGSKLARLQHIFRCE